MGFIYSEGIITRFNIQSITTNCHLYQETLFTCFLKKKYQTKISLEHLLQESKFLHCQIQCQKLLGDFSGAGVPNKMLLLLVWPPQLFFIHLTGPPYITDHQTKITVRLLDRLYPILVRLYPILDRLYPIPIVRGKGILW